MAQQTKRIEEMRLAIEVEVAYLDELKQHHTYLVEERKHTTRKRKVMNQ